MKSKPIDEALRDFQVLFRMPVSWRGVRGGGGRGRGERGGEKERERGGEWGGEGREREMRGEKVI